MGKKFAIISVIILISGLVILGYFLKKGREFILTDPYIAISPSAALVIEAIDLQSLINSVTTGKGLFGEAGKIKEFEAYNLKIRFLADQLNKAGYKKFLNGTSSVISLNPTAEGKLQSLISMAVSSDVRLRQVKEILKGTGIKTINDSEINGINVLVLPYNIKDQKDTVFVSLVSGLLVASTASGLMKETMEQMAGRRDVRNVPGFSRILQASGKNENRIFVIFRNLPDLLKPAFRKDYSYLAGKTGIIAGCSAGDIYLSESGIVLSGYTESIDSSEILYKYKNGTPGVFQTYKILPSSTVLFESVMLNQIPRIAGKENIPEGTTKLVSEIRNYIGEEVTRAYIAIKGKPAGENELVIYKLKDRVYAEKIFMDNFNQKGNEENVFYFQPDDQIRIPVFLTSFKGFSSAVVPGFFREFNDSYFAFFDNYLITGSSYITVSRLLYDNMLNKTLANDLIYRNFESTLPTISGYFFYCVPSGITDYLAEFLNDDLIKFLKSNKSFFSKIQAAGYQFTPSNDMIYNSLSIQFKEEAREESTTEWETLLDTLAAIKPFFFTNHTTGAKEIFIQDLKNNIYLINAAGRVLWKVPLMEKINGSVYMIDYFRNGKFQLLFSGRNYLHLLDRNGNYVERYPVKLRSPATNSLALFDYDNNKNYRLLIAGEDKILYAYDKAGSAVKGWKPFRTNGIITSEVSWFRVSGKDFLALSDETSVYFLDRTGNKRLTLKEPVTKARGSTLRLTSGSSPSVVCSAPDGTIQHIYFDGSVRKFSKQQFSVDHCFDIFDIDGDGFGEYIFIDKGILYLYDHNRSEMFSKQFGSDNLGGPINFVFSASDRTIGVFDLNQNLIYLIKSTGEVMNGFPLKGASMFSIGKLADKKGWNLIVGGTDRFLYNYKLNTEIK